MPCYHPLQGWKSRTVSKNGKRRVVFSVEEAFVDLPVTVACGQCIGCRIDRSAQWAARIMHEASLHDQNWFVTLTYEDAPVSLVKRDWQLFAKRVRRRGRKFRFFHCGEYGGQTNRPHYHAVMFGLELDDLRRYKDTASGHTLYTSAFLEECWQLGRVWVGTVTFDSAQYVAKYVLKKVTGEAADDHYRGRLPEYVTMSNRPGIGAEWFGKFSSDLYPDDFVVTHSGNKLRVPRFYDTRLEKEDPKALARFKVSRQVRARKRAADNTPERLAVREEVMRAALKLNERDDL